MPRPHTTRQHDTTQHKTRQDNNTRRGRDETRRDKDRTRERQEEAREKARERRQASRLEGASEREKTRVKPAAWIAANFARQVDGPDLSVEERCSIRFI